MFFRKIMLTIVLCIFSVNVLFALTIKLGSVAPDGSPWDTSLKKMAAKWYEISNGEVRVKIYPGGIVGDEPDMIRKIRIGQLHSAIFTQIGMGYISPEVLALSLPMLINNDAELNYLLKKTTPMFDKYIYKKGFTVIAWAKVGWVNFFTKNPVLTPENLMKHKIAVVANEPQMLQSWRQTGFNAIPLSANDTLSGLQSGMVNAFYATPLVSASFQWFALAPNMCTLKIAPMVGGVVVSNKTWKKIPEKYREKFRKATNDVLDELYIEKKRLERQAVAKMKKHGLKINKVNAAHIGQWKKVSKKGYKAYIGKSFPISVLNKIKKHLREYRSR